MDLSTCIACHSCDVVIELKQIETGEKASCPRCGTKLYSGKENYIDRTLAYSLAALIFYIPANFFPILTLTLIGNTRANSLFTGVHELFDGGYYFVSILVLLTSIVLPFISISTLIYTMISIKFGIELPGVNRVFRIHEEIHHWVMLEVYMLGILVALTKLGSIAKASFGIGLYCYIILLLLTIFASVSYDSFTIWKRIEKWTN